MHCEANAGTLPIRGSAPRRVRLPALVAILLISRLGIGWVQESQWHDPSPHRVLSVEVAPNVKLEVLDWGGAEPAVVLLAGLGNTAHIFDNFAPKLARTYHVYGITRRGFGASSAPPSGYTTDRLARDVIEVIESLKIQRPIVAGHSFAGEEMTVLGTQFPTRVAGLVYLEAAYDRTSASFAKWNTLFDRARPPPPGPEDEKSYSAFRAWYVRTMGIDPPEADLRESSVPSPYSPIGAPRTPPSVSTAILSGLTKPDYGGIGVPALAIYAVPRSEEDVPGFGTASQSVVRDLFQVMKDEERTNSAVFRSAVREARVIEIPGAKHLLFLSNEEDVLRAIRAFVLNTR
jgi:pimeloyl-ACP methyl ester carboxylesterase